MPDDVMKEFNFAPIEGLATTAKTKKFNVPSMALLMSVLVDKHGWKLIQSCGGNSHYDKQYIFQKDA